MCAQTTKSSEIASTFSVDLGKENGASEMYRTFGIVTAGSHEDAKAPAQTRAEPTLEEMATAVSTLIGRLIDRFGLRAGAVAGILGVSPSYMTKLRRGDTVLTPDSHPYENAVLFLRTLEAINSMLGTPVEVHEYLTRKHAHLGAAPIQMMTTPEGLVDVTRYVESFVH